MRLIFAIFILMLISGIYSAYSDKTKDVDRMDDEEQVEFIKNYSKERMSE